MGAAGLTLDTFLGLVGGDFVDVLHSPAGLDLPVVAVLIHDTSTAVQINPGDLVLGIGLRAADPDTERLVAEVGPDTVLAFKIHDDAERARIRALGESHGATVLAISPEMSWDQLHSLARTSIASAAATVPDERGVPFGDLFALANSAAAMLEGPVIIDDERMEVIAFSSLGDPIDEIREHSILHRRPPREFMDWCESTGILPRVRQSLTPVRVVPPDGATRLVTAIRGGSDILGYLWVAESKHKLDQHSADLLAETARVAALQLLRSRISEDLDRRLRSDLLRNALAGRANAATVQSRLGLDGVCFRLVAFVPDRPGPAPAIPELRPLEDLVALRVEASRRRGAVTSCDGRIYATFPVADRTPDEPARLAREITGQADRQLHLRLRAAISGEIASAAQLAEARRAADRLLDLPLLDESRRVLAFDDSIADAILSEITEILRERPRLLQGGVAGMVVSDRDCGTEHLASLRAFFDAGGDLTAAGRAVYVHRNTLKYRLTRIRDIFGIDVEDPAQRLVAQLQVAAFTAHPELLAELPVAPPRPH
ncbi:PucR family transcriptional regulator [Amycolatopsis echigonensis]|uniref:Helix-turn-helix domain-containing protein n=1 Tax=Amycolatopsis echigonensis TaxID=2576905 RepID=A0A8E1W7T8_9PSEU|nr:PucR family transcriptional regulator [Amycolatopsis echigonensis]MBB2505227.1 helix-turn-helix domain-containing protein [Amycolatopsis echigonensis]